MADKDIPLHRMWYIAGGLLLVLGMVVGVAYALLLHWHLAPGGEAGARAIVETIPLPRLQTAPPAPMSQLTPAPDFEQRLGERLPPGLHLVDAAGQPIDWSALAVSGRPLVLLPAYYRCDTLCGTVAHGALEALADTGLPPDSWRLLLFSIDTADRPADALALQTVYADYAAWARPAVYTAHPPDLRLLTGAADQTAAVAGSIGFRWQLPSSASGAAAPQLAHPTGLVVLTPQGQVSRYFFGVRFDPAKLRSALVDAADGHVGDLSDRLLLACAHFDPLPGSHDAQIAWLLRAVGLSVLAALGLWIWRHRSAPPRSRA